MRKIKPKHGAFLIHLTLIAAALLFSVMPRIFAQPTTVSIQPTTVSIIPQNNIFSTKTTLVNSNFTVNATVTNVTNLWNWQTKVLFNPSMIQCASAVIPSDSPFKFPIPGGPIIDNVTGYVMLGASQIVPIGINGSGVLATINFTIISAPTTPGGTLSCGINYSRPYDEDTYLNDPDMLPIPATLVDGYYEYTWPSPPLPYLEVRPSIYNATELGKDVAIEIWVHNVSEDWEIIGLQFALRFNASLLDPMSVEAGTFMEAFANDGESVIYAEGHDYMGDAALPDGFNAWTVGVITFPDMGNWHEPFPSGEGLLATLHFNATMETAYPEIAWTDLNFTNLINNPLDLNDDFKCYTLNVDMNEISFQQLIGGNYRAPCTCNLTITTTAGGSTNPEPGIHTYSVGTSVTVTPIPTGFYKLDHWVLDGVNKTDNPINVVMNVDHNLQAVFVLPNYTLTIISSTGGTVNATTQSYVAGTNVTVTASPNLGYNFSHWKLDGTRVSNETSYKVTMNANHTLQAVFEDVTPPEIVEVTQDPSALNVLENEAVLVSVNVTDIGSRVKNVTLIYTTNNWTTSASLDMTFNASTGLWKAEIPGKAFKAVVKYKIVAYDNAGNRAVDDKTGNYYAYMVIPEFSAFGILLILLGATLSALVLTKKSRKPKAYN